MSTHESFDDFEEVQAPSDRSFGFLFTAAFGLVGLLPLFKGGPVRKWALVVATLFLISALIAPSMIHGLNVLWTSLSLPLSKVGNFVVTGLIFYMVFTPVAFVLRLMGRNVLRLRFKPGAATYWVSREGAIGAPGTMRNQF